MADTTNPAAPAASASPSAASPAPTGAAPDEATIAADPRLDEGVDFDEDNEFVDSDRGVNGAYLHGRTFRNLAGTEYWGPSDDIQLEGADVNHHMLYLALEDKLCLAPIENPQTVLDVGTGTGIWAIDFADEYPSADVVGVDLAPNQPSWVPPNCRFEIDDLSKTWTFRDETFDYIHIRWMMGSIEDWVKVYKECYRCLKPGGWVEHMDCSIVVRSNNNTFPEDSIWGDWFTAFTECAERTGRTLRICDDDTFAEWMKEAGFPDVQTRHVKVPIGDWPAEKRMKDVGRFNKLAAELGLEGYVLYLMTTVLGWGYADVQVWLAKVRSGLKQRNQQPYNTWGVAWAQKPLA
ncbi:hypothetical protein OQA88_5634 [Cercophora sp. LCS_1]